MAAQINLEARIALADRMTRRLRRSAAEANRFGRLWRKTGVGMIWTFQRIGRAARRMGRAGIGLVNRGLRTMTRRAKFALIGLQLMATIMAGIALHSALQYESALRNVTSLMTGAGVASAQLDQEFTRLDGSIRRMSIRWGKAPEDLARGMYNVVSATFDAASGQVVLEQSAKLATAGLTDVDTATGLMTKTLQGYRTELDTNADLAERSAYYNDLFFTGLKRGIFTMDEFAKKFPELPATMAAFGIEVEEVIAMMSTLTRGGLSLDEAVTGARALALNIASIAPQSEAAARELFGTDWEKVWGPAALAAQGFEGVMTNLQKVLPKVTPELLDVAAAIEEEQGLAAAQMKLAEVTGESIVTITNLIPNVRALKAAVILAGPGLQGFTEDITAMETSLGAADQALTEIEKTALFWKDRMTAIWSTVQVDIGALAFPAITQAGEGISNWMSDLAFRSAATSGTLGELMAEGLVGDDLMAAVTQAWDEMSPWDRLYFMIVTGWGDLMERLRAWWTGGGQDTTFSFGESVGSFIRSLFGIGSDAGPVSDSLGYQVGETFVAGFTSAFEGFTWGEFFSGILGRAVAGVGIWRVLFGGGGGGGFGSGGAASGAATGVGFGLGRGMVTALGAALTTTIGAQLTAIAVAAAAIPVATWAVVKAIEVWTGKDLTADTPEERERLAWQFRETGSSFSQAYGGGGDPQAPAGFGTAKPDVDPDIRFPGYQWTGAPSGFGGAGGGHTFDDGPGRPRPTPSEAEADPSFNYLPGHVQRMLREQAQSQVGGGWRGESYSRVPSTTSEGDRIAAYVAQRVADAGDKVTIEQVDIHIEDADDAEGVARAVESRLRGLWGNG